MSRSASSRYQACNGETIRSLRRALGWTQAELAQKAGYSVRLIQKAESGGSLAPTTLEVLAQTLKSDEMCVTVSDLSATPLTVVQEFISLLNEHVGETGVAAQHLLAEDISVWCAGDPQEVPFAGEYLGIKNVIEFFRTFSAVLTASPEGLLQNVRYLANGPIVVCWAEAYAHVEGMPGPMPTVWVNHRYEVRSGKIVRFENHFDTQVGTQHLAEARARNLIASVK